LEINYIIRKQKVENEVEIKDMTLFSGVVYVGVSFSAEGPQDKETICNQRN
jgi:hypothetical protein